VSGLGVPDTITSNRGRQFESALWEQLTRLLDIQRINTTANHPIANGIVEHELKATLKTYPSPDHWTVTPHSTQRGSPLHELVYGTSTGRSLPRAPLHTPAQQAVYISPLSPPPCMCLLATIPLGNLQQPSTGPTRCFNGRTSISSQTVTTLYPLTG
jgi:hypothetical protein